MFGAGDFLRDLGVEKPAAIVALLVATVAFSVAGALSGLVVFHASKLTAVAAGYLLWPAIVGLDASETPTLVRAD